MSKLSGHELGVFLREQRQAARLSLRQLSDLAGISNPYLSQIERGLKKPSAEILQGLARGLKVSAETLYVHAGILDAAVAAVDAPGVPEAIAADPKLTDRQRAVLLDVYQSFAAAASAGPAIAETSSVAESPSGRTRTSRKPGAVTKTRSATKTRSTSRATSPAKPARKPARSVATRPAAVTGSPDQQ
ncbi:MAG: helix-turn-helix domain-containing protein [Actinomycetota bacterium]|nr:helix-turn-helix domain-containing protein [Actinomycetota bacterium]